jgi:hypothetical protein
MAGILIKAYLKVSNANYKYNLNCHNPEVKSVLGICVVKNPHFANVLDKVIATLNSGGGGAARVELGDMLNVQLEKVFVRHTKGTDVATVEMNEPTVTTVFSGNMMFMTLATNGETQKINIFRHRARKRAPGVFEFDTPTGKTEIAFPM